MSDDEMREVLANELRRQCSIGAGWFNIDDGYGQSGLWCVNADLDSGALIRALRQVEQRAYEDAARVADQYPASGGYRQIGRNIATAIRARSPLIRESTSANTLPPKETIQGG